MQCRCNTAEARVRGWNIPLKKVRERARPLPNDSEFHCERGGSMCMRCRCSTPEPGVRGWGMHLKKKSGSGRARSQTILNSIVREEGRCACGVGAAPPNPGPGVKGFTMVAAARRSTGPHDAARCGLAHGASMDLSAALGLAQSQQLPPRLHHQHRLAQFRGALLRPHRGDVVGFGDHGGGGSSRLAASRTAP